MEDKLLNFINNDIRGGSLQAKANSSLFKEGLLSSLELVMLIDFIEKEFGISVPGEEVDFDNFDTVELIAEFVRSKQQ